MNDKSFDKRVETYDWRYSAAAVGLIRFFQYHDPFEEHYIKGEDFIKYDSSLVNEENYLKFVEYHYGDKFHHVAVQNMLKKKEFSDDDIKLINDKLQANTIMKNTFKKVKFNGENKDEIISLIDENRMALIKETFRRKRDMYINYSNDNQLFNDSQKFCRLNGYYIDAPKKGKSTGFSFSMDTFVGQDISEFDFIPFAFSGEYTTFFVNDNYNLKRLYSTNEILKKNMEKDTDDLGYRNKKYVFFDTLINSADFINYDVEVITKNSEKDHFDTLYLRKQSIDILKQLKDYRCFCFTYYPEQNGRCNENYYIDIQQEVMNCILNNTLLDLLIEALIKDDRNYNYLVNQMIRVNILIKEVNNMYQGSKVYNSDMEKARQCAKTVAKKLEENKLKSYRQKLISSLSFRDYDRVCDILLKLSQYTEIYFNFTYKLYEDFEANKEIAYAFVNDLDKGVLVSNDKKENKQNKKGE